MNCARPVQRLRRDKLLHVAKRVLGSEEAARTWAKTPNPSLDGHAPEALTETVDGLLRALAELESLESSSVT